MADDNASGLMDELGRIREAVEAMREMGGVRWSGAGATRELHETIKRFDEAATRQTSRLIGLTWVIAALTLAMFLGLVAQIWLAWHGRC